MTIKTLLWSLFCARFFSNTALIKYFSRTFVDKLSDVCALAWFICLRTSFSLLSSIAILTFKTKVICQAALARAQNTKLQGRRLRAEINGEKIFLYLLELSPVCVPIFLFG